MRRVLGWYACCAAAILLVATSCGGSTAQFTLSSASVDAIYPCPSGASNAAYYVHAAIAGHNGTSSPVSISAVSAVMTLAAVHGGWLQALGSKYAPASVVFAPNSVGAGSTATLNLTIPSACTNLAKSPGTLSYADYSVSFKVTTSAGIFSIDSKNRHRIIAF